MKRFKKFVCAAALAVGLLGAASAQADVHWQANWSPSNDVIIAGDDSTVEFTNLNKSSYTTTAKLPVINTPTTNLTIKTEAPTNDPDVFVGQNYKLVLELTDTASGKTKSFDFLGKLSGTISTAGAAISNMFDPVTAIQTWTVPENGNFYTINLKDFVAPGSASNINTKGAMGADITVVAGDGGGQVHDTPEPSTLALAGLGMAFTGLAAWRRRKLNAATDLVG